MSARGDCHRTAKSLFRHEMNLLPRFAIIADHIGCNTFELTPVVPLADAVLHLTERFDQSLFGISSKLQDIPQLLHFQSIRMQGAAIDPRPGRERCGELKRDRGRVTKSRMAHLVLLESLLQVPLELFQGRACLPSLRSDGSIELFSQPEALCAQVLQKLHARLIALSSRYGRH